MVCPELKAASPERHTHFDVCGLLTKRHSEEVTVTVMADGEGAVCSGIDSRSAGDCKDIGGAGWWCMGKVAVEPPTLDGDLTLSEYQRQSTLQPLETRIR